MALAPGEARKDLSADALFRSFRSRFASLPDPRSGRGRNPLGRCPDVGLCHVLAQGPIPAGLRRPPLRPRRQLPHDLWDDRVPSDSQMRAILDPVDPVGSCEPRSARSSVACNVARCSNASPIWKAITWRRWTAPRISPPQDPLLLLPGEAPSQRHRHLFPCQLLGATLVHPDLKEVIPLAPEPIIQQDGQTKNDCERNATRRWLKRFRQEHPHLPVIVVEDALMPTPPTSATCVRLGRITSLASSRATTPFSVRAPADSRRARHCRFSRWSIRRRAFCIIFGSATACRSTSRTPTSWSTCWNTGRSTPMGRYSISVGSPTFS